MKKKNIFVTGGLGFIGSNLVELLLTKGYKVIVIDFKGIGSNKKNLKIQSFWSNSLKIGICGDWFGGPRYENGWISASDLYKKMTN